MKIQIKSNATAMNEEMKTKVKLGDTLKLRYVYTGNVIRIRIVETQNNINTLKGVQKIHCKTTFGTSLIGRSEGEIVKIGCLDNYVEILKIMKSETVCSFNIEDNLNINGALKSITILNIFLQT